MDKKVIARTSSYEVAIEGRKINVDLFEIAYSEKEVLAILDAYQKALYERLGEERKEAKRFVILGGKVEFDPGKGGK